MKNVPANNSKVLKFQEEFKTIATTSTNKCSPINCDVRIESVDFYLLLFINID